MLIFFYFIYDITSGSQRLLLFSAGAVILFPAVSLHIVSFQCFGDNPLTAFITNVKQEVNMTGEAFAASWLWSQ